MSVLDMHQQENLAPLEMTSLLAIISFLEHERGFHRENICDRLTAELKVLDMIQIKPSDFDRAIKFLADLFEVSDDAFNKMISQQ